MLLLSVDEEQVAAVHRASAEAAGTGGRTCAVAEAGRGIDLGVAVAASASSDLAGQPVRSVGSVWRRLCQQVRRTIMMDRWRPFLRCRGKVVNAEASCAREESVEMVTVSWHAM